MLKVCNANCSVEELYKMFERFGSCRINCTNGVALVAYDQEEMANRAMMTYNNFTLNRKRLSVRPYKGGPVTEDYGQMEVEEPQIQGVQNGQNDRVDLQALQKIRNFKAVIEGLLKKRSEELGEFLRNSVQGMMRDQLTSQQQKAKISQFIEVLNRQTKKVAQSIDSNLGKFVRKVANFDAGPIGLENDPKPSKPSLLTAPSHSINFLQPSRPFFGTHSSPAKRLIKVNDEEFICAFGGQNYCRYYNVNDLTPRFGEKMEETPSALGLFTSIHHHYNLIGDNGGSIRIVKLNPFEKQIDNFHMHKETVTDIKQYNGNQFMSCSTDYLVRCWRVAEEQRMKDDYSLVIEKTDEYPVVGRIKTMDILNESEVILGLTQQKVVIMPLQKGNHFTIFPQNSPVLKVLKHSQKHFWASVSKQIQLLDSQSRSVAIVFDNFGQRLRPFAKLSENLICFGGQGRVGLLDKRNNKSPIWKDDTIHDKEVGDLVCLGSTIISCGLDQKIVKWNAR